MTYVSRNIAAASSVVLSSGVGNADVWLHCHIVCLKFVHIEIIQRIVCFTFTQVVKVYYCDWCVCRNHKLYCLATPVSYFCCVSHSAMLVERVVLSSLCHTRRLCVGRSRSTVHPALVVRPFVILLIALIPHSSLHHSLICGLACSV